MKTEKRYFSTRQAMEYTGLGESSLDSLMDGKIIRPSELYNGRKYYDKVDIDAAMQNLKGC